MTSPADASQTERIPIRYFLLADCKLFRTPVVKTSELDQKIEQIILQAWQRGENPTRLVDAIVKEATSGSLKDAVGENFEQAYRFQRAAKVNKVEQAAEAAKQLVETRYQQLTTDAETKAKEALDVAYREREQAATTIEAVRQERSVVESHVKAFQQGVREKLGDAARAEEVGMLFSIYEDVVGENASATERALTRAVHSAVKNDASTITSSKFAQRLCQRLGYAPTLTRTEYAAIVRADELRRRPPAPVRVYKAIGRLLE
jgi:hypothetical protein